MLYKNIQFNCFETMLQHMFNHLLLNSCFHRDIHESGYSVRIFIEGM